MALQLLLVSCRRGIRLLFSATADEQHSSAWGLCLASTSETEIRSALTARPGPDVAVVDVEPCPGDAIRSCDIVHGCAPALPILILACCPQSITVEEWRAFRANGAVGAVDLAGGKRSIRQAITDVASGVGVFQLRVPAANQKQIGWPADHWADLESSSLELTPRERTILSLLARGLTQEQVAGATHLSQRTVVRTVATLQEKMGARSLFALGTRAAQLGLVG